MRTPDYVLRKAHTWGRPPDERVLPENAFVRPLELHYVPRHVTESPSNKWFNKEREVYCFTRYGIIPIPIDLLREVR